MSQAYDVDDVIRLEALARSAVGRWGLAGSTELALVNLSENATYVVQPPDGEPLVLRVGRPDYSTPEEVASELAWVDALRGAGAVSTPPVVPAADGSSVVVVGDRPCVMFGFVSGTSPDEDGELVAPFGVLGGLTAQLHAHARAWERPPGFVRRRWDHATMVGATPHWGRWQDGMGVGPAELDLLGRLCSALEERLADYGVGPERFGLVHADMRLANVLVDGDDVHVIDFDDSGFSWFMYDLAAALTFIEDRPDLPALVRAWLDGYAAAGTLTAADEAIVPTMIMLRRLLVLAWIGSHANTPLAQSEGLAYTVGTCALAERYLAGEGPGV